MIKRYWITILMIVYFFFGAAQVTVAQDETPSPCATCGTLVITCPLLDVLDGEEAACQVSIDEVVQPGLVAAGGSADYELEAGRYTVTVDVVGAQAERWAPAAQTQAVYVVRGNRAQVVPRLVKQALLQVSLGEPGLTADFYLNGDLLAEASETVETWVSPYRTYRVEARTILDPEAGDLYTWSDTTNWQYATPGGTYEVVLRPRQRYLKGFIEVTCEVQNAASEAGAMCLPTLDDEPQEMLLPGETATYVVEPGSHELTVALGPEGVWAASAKAYRPYVYAGRTRSYTPSFRLVVPTPTPLPGSNARQVYGTIQQNTTWRGEILVIGDVRVTENATLTIAPGTRVYIAAHSDIQNLDPYEPNLRQGVNDGPAIDGVEQGEPFRDEGNHVSIRIGGTLRAAGTPDQPILITSNSETPWLGDWNELYIERGILEYATVEYNRLTNLGSGAVARNNTIRYASEYGLGAWGDRSPVIENNTISYAGHELIYAGGENMVIRNNTLGPNPMEFGAGSIPTGGICIAWSSPSAHIVEGNTLSGCTVGVMFVFVAPPIDPAVIEGANVFTGNGSNFVIQN